MVSLRGWFSASGLAAEAGAVAAAPAAQQRTGAKTDVLIHDTLLGALGAGFQRGLEPVLVDYLGVAAAAHLTADKDPVQSLRLELMLVRFASGDADQLKGQGFGMPNFSLNCFLSALVQSLLHSNPVARAVLKNAMTEAVQVAKSMQSVA